MLVVKIENHIKSARAPNLPALKPGGKEPAVVALAGRWKIRQRGLPASTRPRGQRQFVHLVGGVEECVSIGITAEGIQLTPIRGQPEVRAGLRPRRTHAPRSL